MLQAKSAQKRQTAIPLKRRNPVDGTLVIILIMLLLAGLLVLFSATFYTGTSTRSPYRSRITLNRPASTAGSVKYRFTSCAEKS